MAGEFPRALPRPEGPYALLRNDTLTHAIEMSRASPRGRIILPLHDGAGDPTHRMFNAMQPGTYVRPHKHLDPPKSEVILCVRGKTGVVFFDENGTPTEHALLEPGGAVFGVDIRPGVFHTFVALAPDTVIFEAKTGPYQPASDKDFAPWAPAEGSPGAAAYWKTIEALFGVPLERSP
ncbi:MAG: hypothetical protein GMKNLPBB_01344 [Myxococcota bacterium]|nr:hypothetical protein [Myxococcota bacterium]